MNRISLSFALACALALPSVLRAQARPDGTVTGSGRVDIKRQPEFLRLQMTITADGKDIVEAAGKLKEAQASARKKLAELGAAEKSVEFGSIQVGGNVAADPRQQYIERARGGGKAQKQPQSVTVASTLKAEWPLKPAAPEELLIAGYTLQEKIKAAGVGKSQSKPLTPEEQEAVEEAQGLMQGQPNPNDPVFQYVARVSADDRASALAEAYQKARADATRLAKAAGAELGALRHVAGAENSVNENGEYVPPNGAAVANFGEPESGEAIGANPGPVELHISVAASFDLK